MSALFPEVIVDGGAVHADGLGNLGDGGEALRRQVEPIVKAAEQFVRDARRAKGSGGPAPGTEFASANDGAAHFRHEVGILSQDLKL